jgi:hypothetical protein
VCVFIISEKSEEIPSDLVLEMYIFTRIFGCEFGFMNIDSLY